MLFPLHALNDRPSLDVVAAFAAEFERLVRPAPCLRERTAAATRALLEIDIDPDVAGYRPLADAVLERLKAPAKGWATGSEDEAGREHH
jgi:hypothetical protein